MPSCARTLLVAAAVLLGGATTAFAQGTISGTVTNAALVPLPNTEIHIYDLSGVGDFPSAIVTTNAAGFYSVNLPSSIYGILTQNKLGYINEIYDNVPCSAECDSDNLTPVPLPNGGNVVANFALDPGGRMAGRVTDAIGNGIAGVKVWFVPATGDVPFTTAITNANGDYVSDGGTVTGTVYAFTTNLLGYQNEVWDDIKCDDCDPTQGGTGIPVTIGVTTGGIDFDLDIGGTISGTVRGPNLEPLAGIEVTIFDANGEPASWAITDASGNFISGGLISGNYYVGTQNISGHVDEMWDNVPCINAQCNSQSGTPIAVTLGVNTGNIDFVLAAGGQITGSIVNAVGGGPIQAFVGLIDAAGLFVGGDNASAEGFYTIRGIPPGTYYVNVLGVPGFFSQIYNGQNCTTNCNTTALGTPIHVTVGGSASNINFALVPTTSVGSISGTVRDVTAGFPGTAVSNINVQLFSFAGQQVANVNTDALGVYTFANLAPGSYYVRTNGGGQLINQLYNGVWCVNCPVTTSGGTLIPVAAGGTATINFNLVQGGRISGTVTNAAGGATLSGIGVLLFSSTGVGMGQYNTNGSGVFTTRGLPAGTYYLRTTNTQGFVDELYDNQFCPGSGCNVTAGTPVAVTGTATTTGRDFALVQGGRISGTVSGPLGVIQFNANVQVYANGGAFLGLVNVDGSGNYTTFAVPAGTYFLRTGNAIGLVDELYDNIPCPNQCLVTAGTPVAVTAGATLAGRNFTLSAGGNIGGTVRDANTNALLPQIRVAAVLADGTFVKTAVTNANGEYAIVGLSVGTYYLRTSVVGAFYLDELYNEIPCPLTCTITNGEPIVVAAGVTQGAKNFTLTPGGGLLSGYVRDATGTVSIGAITVGAYLPDGTLVKTASSNGLGYYSMNLPAGTYRARTLVNAAGAYVDELYYDMPCSPGCNVATGNPIEVFNGIEQPNIDFSLAANLVRNGRFEAGTSNWVLFATPTPSNLVSQVTNGVFEYYRVGSSATQAVVFQETGTALPANTPLIARFAVGNSSSARKRISVLVLDSNFSDLSVCTFWIPANTPLTPYRMITHTTQAWANASIYFYAASGGSNGGFYQLDNVSLEHAPAESDAETTCVDPLAPAPSPGTPDGPDLLVNGNFDTGALSPWGVFGQISSQIVGGVFQFTKLAGTPAGVVLQPTGVPLPGGTILTATFQLGNSSAQRQRVTAILHDNTFGDLSACTFYVPAGQPLSDYTVRMFTTQAWANATVSVYPATTNGQQWVLLDNVTLRTTQSATILGTECVEPGGTTAATAVSSGIASAAGFSAASGLRTTQDGARREPQVLQRDTPIDLTAATSATFAFRAWLPRSAAWAEVQVRGDDGEWRTVHVIRGSDDWAQLAVDLTEYLGQVVDLRVVVYRE